MPTGELRLNAEQYLMNTYTRQPISIVRGRGSKVYDLEGREYIDFVAGIAVNLLGHGHPDLVLAIQKQVQPDPHIEPLLYRAAGAACSDPGRTFVCAESLLL